MLAPFMKLFSNKDFLLVLKVLYYALPVWLPALLLYLAWELWINYRRSQFFAKQTYILLEIKLPKEIFKSPQAAEFFISALFQTFGEKNWYEKYWKGMVRAWFSLEIVSIDGVVHFFVWTRSSYKNLIEANLYSQYPGIEIFEVPDYTLPAVYDREINSIWASEIELTKPDAFPIKTYIDYGMDKDPKEEYKIDPMTPLIEFLGSLPRGNQAWIQIIIRSHKDEERDPKEKWRFWKKKDLRWKEGAQVEIDKILEKAKGEKGEDGKLIPGSTRRLTDVESDTVKALGRSVSKKGFDVGMRIIYIAPKDIFNISNVGGIVGGITHFNSHLNGFKPVRSSEERYKFFAIAWMKRRETKRDKERQNLLDAYKHRMYFYKPHRSPHFILNAEELATIYHFPGGVSGTPTFGRVESRKVEAPTNLPI